MQKNYGVATLKLAVLNILYIYEQIKSEVLFNVP